MSSGPVIHLERGRYYREDQSEIDDLLAEIMAPIQCPVCNNSNSDAPRLVENIEFITSDNPEEVDLTVPHVAHIIAICKDCYKSFREEVGMSDDEVDRKKIVLLIKRLSEFKLPAIYVLPDPMCLRIKEGDVKERFYTRFEHERFNWGIRIKEDHFWFARADNGVHISVFNNGYILAVSREWSSGYDRIVNSAVVDWPDLKDLVNAIKDATPETLSFLQELLFLRCRENNTQSLGVPIDMGNIEDLLKLIGIPAPDQPSPLPSSAENN